MHAHIFTETTDCDGKRQYQSTVPGVLIDDSFEDWRMDILRREIDLDAPFATVHIDKDRVRITDQHEEGYSHTEIRWCDCPDGNAMEGW